MIKTTTFNNTTGSERFKEFLKKPFTIDVIDNNSNNVLFEEWRLRSNLKGWSKFIYGDNTLEFFPTYYTIKKNKPADSIQYMLSIPLTINDFIDDMFRFGIQLYWNNKIDSMFEPKEYLHVDEIKGYFEELLGKMDKSHELL